MDTLTLPRRRVAVVVQRYGPGVPGGAEAHARELVHALASRHEVTVLTSCAIDAMSWAMHFPPGRGEVDGVAVERFSHPPRHAGGRARVPRRHKLRWWLRRVCEAFRLERVPAPRGDDITDGHQFLRRQGPACDGLIERLRAATEEFDTVVFFTALYFPTAEGLPAWGRRSVLIPTLHDEKPMQLPWFRRVFASAGLTLYNTRAEEALAGRLYGTDAGRGRVVGSGVHVRPPTPEQVETARTRHALPSRYLVYVGRVEKGKGCAALLDAWLAVVAEFGDAALVFVGQGDLPIPVSAQVRRTGFIAAEERDALVAGASALVLPSASESLSLVLLEAMALGVPTLVNAASQVLEDHVRTSGAGEGYRGAAALRRGLRAALQRSAAERARMGEAGQRYVQERYAWPRVHAEWFEAVEQTARLRCA